MVENGAETPKTEKTALLRAGQGGAMKTTAMYQDLVKRTDEERLADFLKWADNVEPNQLEWIDDVKPDQIGRQS